MFDKMIEESSKIKLRLIKCLDQFSNHNEVRNKHFLLEVFLDYFEMDRVKIPECYINKVTRKKDLQTLVEKSIKLLLDRTKNLDSTTATVLSALVRAMVTLNLKTNKKPTSYDVIYKDVLDMIPREYLILYLKLEDSP